MFEQNVVITTTLVWKMYSHKISKRVEPQGCVFFYINLGDIS